MIKATTNIPDRRDTVQLSGNAKAAMCGGRFLVSDHRHVGFYGYDNRRVQLLHCGCIYSAEEEQR